MYDKLICIRIPCSPPTLRHDFFIADGHCSITGIIETELIISGYGSLQFALICNLRAIELEIFRKIDDTCHFRSYKMLEINLRFLTYDRLAMGRNIGTCEDSFLSVPVIKLEDLAKLLVILRISETHHRIAVHEDTVSLVRNNERNRHLRIVLEQLLVLSLVVEFVRLMLSEAVESLIFRRLEHLTESISMSAFNLYGLEALATALLLFQNDITFRICKPDFSSRGQDVCLYRRGSDRNGITGLLNRKRCPFCWRNYHQAFLIGKFPFRSSGNMDQLFTHHFQTDNPWTAINHILHFYCNS